MLGIPIGWAYGHMLEWGLHKYVLHGMGKKRENFWSFHFHDHHRAARSNRMGDEIYEGHPFKWNPAGKELFGLALLGVAHLPLLPVAPLFVGTLAAGGLSYYRLHKRSHKDMEWARQKLPWHYDHHMGDQNANWGVRRDWVDRMMGTRVEYMGTDKELKDLARRKAFAEKLKVEEMVPNSQPHGEKVPVSVAAK
jgi:sterol desaturase/sphingolipid hydroxylase (fatty acid hydroxylase superfamily)